MAKIYQLYYTRLGKQGSNSGWQVASVSGGTPQLVRNNFYKLASNLVAIGTGSHVPPLAFDLQIMENYVFLSHINYHSVNEGSETDIRGVSFVHGFAIRSEEYRELVREPDQLLGIHGDAIVLNYNGKKELPQLETLPFQQFSRKDILDKYGLDQKRFADLMYCVYGAISTVGGSVVVKSSSYPGEKQRIMFQEITSLIMKYMPYILRMKISAFSGIRQGALICFAHELPEKGIWFDLDTGESHCPQVPEYDFIHLFSNFGLDDQMRKQYYDQLEDFANFTYGGNYEAIKPGHMELALYASCFGNFDNFSDEDLDESIKEAASLKAYKYDKLDPHYANLVNQYLRRGREFPAPEVLKKLQKRYLDTGCKELKEAFASYYAFVVCTPGNAFAYEMLYRMESSRPDDYRDLWQRIEQIRPEFLSAYYIDYYLERQVTDYEKLADFCQKNPDFVGGPAGEKLLDITVNLFDRDFSTAENNTRRHQLCQKYAGLCRSFPQSFQSQAEACVRLFCERYWKDFDEAEFTYKDLEAYQEMNGGNHRDPMVPETVRLLLEARKTFFNGPDTEDFHQTFFTDQVIPSEAARKELVKELHEEATKQGNLPLDAWLLLNLRPDGRFDLNRLIRDMGSSRKLQAAPGLIDALETCDILVPGSEAEERLMEQVKGAVKDKNSHPIIQALYQYYFPPRQDGESGLYMTDLVQKCLMFLAVSLTYVVLVKYLMGESSALGMAAAGIGAAASVGGLVLNLIFGRTNSLELFAEKDRNAILWMIVFLILSLALLVIGVMVSETWIIYIMAAAVAVLLIGRLALEPRS